MKNVFSRILPLALGVLLSSPVIVEAQKPSHAKGELLVASKPGVADADFERAYKRRGGQKLQNLSKIKVHRIKVSENDLEAVEAALREDPNVEFVEKNLIGEATFVPNDPGYPAQWHLPRISAPGGWDVTRGSPSVTIAVIDSGIDPLHPDLSANLVPGYNFVAGNIDTHDIYGHGTAIAGIAGAIGNSGIGVAGVAWSDTIMPLVVLDSSGYGTVANVASAITYAADHGAKVINISLAFNGSTSTLQNAVNYAWNHGVVIVAAAANASTNTPYYPAALPNVIAVSAVDQNDNLASFSNYGNWITVSAPGVSVYTTANGGGYLYGSGTSVSSPIVAGLAALVFSANPNLTNAQVVNLITSNADDVGAPGFDVANGWGRINVQRTLQAAYNTPVITTAITSPSGGSQVSGTVNVSVSATSTAAVNRVELYIDGALGGTAYSSPYSFAWNTNGMSGSHTLSSKAYDSLGDSATSAAQTVSIVSTDKTPPSVQITSVSADSKNLSVTVSVTDTQSGVAKVELYVDGALKATDTAAPWSFKINAKPLSRDSHSIFVKAYDKAANVATSSAVTFTK
jgi:subtilisin family serine protease